MPPKFQKLRRLFLLQFLVKKPMVIPNLLACLPATAGRQAK